MVVPLDTARENAVHIERSDTQPAAAPLA